MLKLKLNPLATWCEELTHWKRPWCWERLKAGGEGDNRGWDGWVISWTRWTWVCVSSGSWWWTGRPAVMYSMGLQTDRHDWASELNWTAYFKIPVCFPPKKSLLPEYKITGLIFPCNRIMIISSPCFMELEAEKNTLSTRPHFSTVDDFLYRHRPVMCLKCRWRAMNWES